MRERENASQHLLNYGGATPAILQALRGTGGLWAASVLFRFLQKSHIGEWKGLASIAMAPTKGNPGLEILCGRIAQELSIPFYQPFYKKAGHRQHGKSAEERMDAELFVSWKQNHPTIPSPCLLMDDLRTTGTTLDQAAYLMRKNGVEVKTFSLARLVAMKGFERESQHSEEESHEVDPFLFHLFM